MLRYTWRELVRNPRRTLVSLAGVSLGVGLFCGVLFVIDGSGATLTTRALAPLTLDLQRVLTSPLGGGLRLEQRISPATELRAGERATMVLTVTNNGSAANDVVLNDEAPAPLAYVTGTTRLNGRALRDAGGRSPLSQGSAGVGLALGAVAPGASLSITYAVRATRDVPSVGRLRLRGSVSSRDALVPIPANAPREQTLARVTRAAAGVPGVAAADALSFVDLPPGSLRAGGKIVRDPLRVFAFDARYRIHHRAIRLVAGSLSPGTVLVSAETARALSTGLGDSLELTLPGTLTRLPLELGGVVDLSRAEPLFSSRKGSKLEQFLYVPNSVVVSPALFERAIVPAFRAQSAALGSLAKSLPTREVDVTLERSRLDADPATALAQTQAVARAIRRFAPDQDYLIDNASNALQVARSDAVVGKRMFLFLGLPAGLLAALLAAYAGSVLAGSQRREVAALRLRGANRRQLRRMLAYRALALAGAGATLGGALGLLAAFAILGRDALTRAAPGDLVLSALTGIGGGVATTALALWATTRRSLEREIDRERRELTIASPPAWRRQRLDLMLLVAAAGVSAVMLRSGALDGARGSVTYGRSVSLPSYLLLAPLLVWAGGTLLGVRALVAAASQIRIPAAPRFGPVVRGMLSRNLRRRAWSLAAGIATLGLVVAFGTSLAIFSASYDAGKAADARFTVGADLRITPAATGSRVLGPAFAATLRVPGVAAVTPVVFRPENSVLVGRANQARTSLAAIEPAGFSLSAPLSDSFFADRSAASAIAALREDPRGLLVESEVASGLGIEPGDRVRVLLARGTSAETSRTFRVVGRFSELPGFPEHVDLVANLGTYQGATRTRRVDFFLADASARDDLAQVVARLRSGPGSHDPIAVDSTATALAKDQSSLTALDLRGLLRLDLLFIVPACMVVVATLIFGLMLQRRREYVALRAQGLRVGELLGLILGEAAFVTLGGLLTGLLAGSAGAVLLVRVLRPLFILPASVELPAGAIVTVALPALAATVAFALVATLLLCQLKPTEVLRED